MPIAVKKSIKLPKKAPAKYCTECGQRNYTTFKLCPYCRNKKLRQPVNKVANYKYHKDPVFKANYTLTAFYQEIWEEREHVSFLTGFPLSFSISNFAHVLAKGHGKYPWMRWYKKNIVLLTPHEHFLYDMGTEELRFMYKKNNPSADWDRLFELRKELVIEYADNFVDVYHFKWDIDKPGQNRGKGR